MVSPSGPGRPRRRLALAVAAAAAVTVGGLWLYRDPARQGDFASDPRPCSLVTAATARLVAGPAEGVETGSACVWAGPGPGPDPQPVLEVRVSRLGTREARESFQRVKEQSEGKTGPMTAELSDFGDEAFSRIRNSDGPRVTSEVWFRQGNVVIAVRYAPVDGDVDPSSHAGAYEVATEAAARLGKGN
ncbi:hypothetical protein ACQKM2_05225 [Streptomyces sp. NPDC004126]|uniref:hypothetical protein n=1 Tax=Streptomyces sp. NPDC004126 TaxID=3390695 RepID=UPI003D083387